MMRERLVLFGVLLAAAFVAAVLVLPGVRHGREGFAEVARLGRLLYPNGQEQNIRHRVIAEGDAVSILNTVIAVTNKGEPYENIYALFFEIEDGKIAKQVELLDFRVAADKFDLSVIA